MIIKFNEAEIIIWLFLAKSYFGAKPLKTSKQTKS
jgi:hypothetical protein